MEKTDEVSGIQKKEYTEIECEKKIVNNSKEYISEINEISEEYKSLIGEYKKDYPTQKLELYKKDFFSGRPSDFYTKTEDEKKEDKETKAEQKAAENKDLKERLDMFPFLKNNPKLLKRIDSGIKKLQNSVFNPNTDEASSEQLKKIYSKNKRIAEAKWDTLIRSNPPVISDIDGIDEQIRQVKNKITIVKENIDKDVSVAQYCGTSINKQIDDLQAENKKLQRKINSLKGKSEGAEGRVFDVQLLYNQYYLGNIIISLVIVYVLYKYLKIFITNNMPEVKSEFLPVSFKKVMKK